MSCSIDTAFPQRLHAHCRSACSGPQQLAGQNPTDRVLNTQNSVIPHVVGFLYFLPSERKGTFVNSSSSHISNASMPIEMASEGAYMNHKCRHGLLVRHEYPLQKAVWPPSSSILSAFPHIPRQKLPRFRRKHLSSFSNQGTPRRSAVLLAHGRWIQPKNFQLDTSQNRSLQ